VKLLTGVVTWGLTFLTTSSWACISDPIRTLAPDSIEVLEEAEAIFVGTLSGFVTNAPVPYARFEVSEVLKGDEERASSLMLFWPCLESMTMGETYLIFASPISTTVEGNIRVDGLALNWPVPIAEARDYLTSIRRQLRAER
jgi:hypothetical protein